jgi:hypothetical protein
VLFGDISLENRNGLTRELLADIESLLIVHVRPWGNIRSRRSRAGSHGTGFVPWAFSGPTRYEPRHEEHAVATTTSSTLPRRIADIKEHVCATRALRTPGLSSTP